MKTGCSTQPTAPYHSIMRCSSASNVCTATCNDEYQFPNGDTKLYFSCVNDEWSIQEAKWEEIPDCERESRGTFLSPSPL